MKIRLLFLILISFLCFQSCDLLVSKNDYLCYYKSHNEFINKELKPPPPLPLGYSSFNIVIDSQYNIYFHYHKLHQVCCVVSEEESNKVRIEYLQKHNFVCLNKMDLKAFYNANKDLCKKHNNNFHSIRIALMIDSIPYKKIKEVQRLITKTDSVNFAICKATDEEKVVIFHKKNNLKYNTEDYAWDTSRNIFIKRENY